MYALYAQRLRPTSRHTPLHAACCSICHAPQVLQNNAVAGSLSHINVMFGSSNSYYTTTRPPPRSLSHRPTSSAGSVMTKQHLGLLHQQVPSPPRFHHRNLLIVIYRAQGAYPSSSSPPRSPNNRKNGVYVYDILPTACGVRREGRVTITAQVQLRVERGRRSILGCLCCAFCRRRQQTAQPAPSRAYRNRSWRRLSRPCQNSHSCTCTR